MSRRLKVGVTGGIGSGKTTVCRIFNVLGIPVFSADAEARLIMDTDKSVMSQVNKLAGRDMYSSGTLDRVGMAQMIFNNKQLLEGINGIIHPVIRLRFSDWEKTQEAPYVILEAAILFESGAVSMLDKVITIIAPVEERIDRVVKRNSLTREQVIERINNQSDDAYKISRSDFIISNSENEMIIPAVIKIHEQLIQKKKDK